MFNQQAFKKWEKLNGVEPLLPGLNLTHDQLFFLNYAQVSVRFWATLAATTFLADLVRLDASWRRSPKDSFFSAQSRSNTVSVKSGSTAPLNEHVLHSVLGPLSNSYDFARSYKCPVGSRMNPTKKCSVWWASTPQLPRKLQITSNRRHGQTLLFSFHSFIAESCV